MKSITASTPFSELPAYLTVPEAAQYLRITKWTLYPLVNRGEVPSVRIGKQVRIPKTALEPCALAGVANEERGL